MPNGFVNAVDNAGRRQATLDATADHGDVHGDSVTGGYAQARADLAALERLGIPYDEVVKQLEDEGVSKFEAAWEDLLGAVATSLSSKGVEGGMSGRETNDGVPPGAARRLPEARVVNGHRAAFLYGAALVEAAPRSRPTGRAAARYHYSC